jgi:hypothetical protein
MEINDTENYLLRIALSEYKKGVYLLPPSPAVDRAINTIDSFLSKLEYQDQNNDYKTKINRRAERFWWFMAGVGVACATIGLILH